MIWLTRGQVCGVDYQTAVDAPFALVRIEASPRVAALLFALGIAFRAVSPSEDSGRAWYQFELDPVQINHVELVDFIADLCYGFPPIETQIADDVTPTVPDKKCDECGQMRSRVRKRKHKGVVHLMCDECLDNFERDQKRLRKMNSLLNNKISRVIFDRDGNKCVRCGTSSQLTVDHIVPVIRGGSNDLSNLQTLCRRCNSKKGTR